jgi:Leucine-rich repeat (LRR) protein
MSLGHIKSLAIPQGHGMQAPGASASISGDNVNLTAASNLTHLHLFNNGLTGTLALPPQLAVLQLNRTSISGVAVSSNKALQSVFIEYSQFDGLVPREILEGPAIQVVNIANTQINGLPSAWQSETLQILNLSGNNITVRLAVSGIPLQPAGGIFACQHGLQA